MAAGRAAIGVVDVQCLQKKTKNSKTKDRAEVPRRTIRRRVEPSLYIILLLQSIS